MSRTLDRPRRKAPRRHRLRWRRSRIATLPVEISYSFAIGVHEVTVREYAAYVADTGIQTVGDCQLRLPDRGPGRGRFLGTAKGPSNIPGLVTISDGDFRQPGVVVSDTHPATCISRREARGYLEWLSKKTGKHYRFPSEAEWEYAGRAGVTAAYHFGKGPSQLCKYANFADRASPYGAAVAAPCAEQPSPQATATVGHYAPNAWGLYDMFGNAFEFIEDCRYANYQGAPADGSPWWINGNENACPNGFVLRGYFFDSIFSDLRSASRCTAGNTWDERSNMVGFRVAVSLDDKAWDRQAVRQ